MPIDDILRRAMVIGAPWQGGALWIGAIVYVLLAARHDRLLSPRNLALLFLVAASALLVDIVEWEKRPDGATVLTWVFRGLFGVTFVAMSWGLVGSMVPVRRGFAPNVPRKALGVLACLLLVMNVCVVMGRKPDDCGLYTNLGAQRWLETGKLPYGDQALLGPESPAHGAAATYGPLLYASHIPFILLDGGAKNAPSISPMDPAYVWPKNRTTKIPTLIFHLLGVVGLWIVGRRLAGPGVALALVCLWCAAPAVIGLGNDSISIADGVRVREPGIGGLVFVSHIAPTALVLLAFAALRRPILSGVLLALGAGVLYWPAFLFPTFFGWFAWKRAGALKFLAGFAVVGIAIATLVFTATDSVGDAGPIDTFLQATLEHQEGAAADQYGNSRFGFWGNHPELASFWQQPLRGESSLTKPAFLAFCGIALLGLLLARRGASEAQFAYLLAMVGAAVQLWKTHAAGTYFEWYLPFLLIGLLAGGRSSEDLHVDPSRSARRRPGRRSVSGGSQPDTIVSDSERGT